MDVMDPNADTGARTPALTPCPLDSQGAIAADAPCVACGYNLRGLTPAGRCPECGAPVAQSVCEPDLRCAPPQWLNRFYSGLGTLLFALFLLPVMCSLSLWAATQDHVLECLVDVISLLVVESLGAAAVMQVTAQRQGARRPRITIAARVCVVSWVLVTPVLFCRLSESVEVRLLATIVYLTAFGAAWTTCLLHLGAVFGRAAPRLALTARVLSGISAAAIMLVALCTLCLGLAEATLGQTRDVVIELVQACSCSLAGLLGIPTWLATIVWTIAARRFVRKEARIVAAWRNAVDRGASQTAPPRRGSTATATDRHA